jgi:protocatechuate 3,4-dioxygenase beta subunit
MKRKKFIETLGMVSLSSVMLPLLAICEDTKTSRSSNNAGSCVLIPTETAGPFPTLLELNRLDIRPDTATGTNKPGILMNLTLNLVNVNNGCLPIANAEIHIWHCSREGVYSEYNNMMNAGSTAEHYLRGWSTTNASGQITFTTIYPGWYNGRATHIHFKVVVGNLTAISQIAFPDATNATVNASTGYTHSGTVTLNASDNVFGTNAGGFTDELASVSGSNESGYSAVLNVGFAGTSCAANGGTLSF